MMCRPMQVLLLVAGVISHGMAVKIRNGIEGEAEVKCSSDRLSVKFNTKENFEGRLYVKGHYKDESCKTSATLNKTVGLSLTFDSCDLRRERSSNPKGLYISTTVVITFHPTFITMVDKAYNVRCFYMEADKTVSNSLDVSLRAGQRQNIIIMLGGNTNDLRQLTGQLRNVTAGDVNLATTVVTQNIPMPTCSYSVLDGGPDGKPVKFAVVGQQLYHKWSCETDDKTEGIFCMGVHTCYVDDGAGRKVQLLDETGCAMDRYLLNNLDYSSDLSGGQSSMVFKFPDEGSVHFECQIRLKLREGKNCTRKSDQCKAPIRGKRSVRSNVVGEAVISNDDEDGEDVDVFSQDMTVFDIDDPISADLDQQEVHQLNLNALVRYKQTVNESKGAQSAAAFCLSPVAFGVLVAALFTVLLSSLITVAVLCCRSSAGRGRSAKLHAIN